MSDNQPVVLPNDAEPTTLEQAIEDGDLEAIYDLIDGNDGDEPEVNDSKTDESDPSPSEGDEGATGGAAEGETGSQEEGKDAEDKDDKDDEPEGILSKDGKNVIPYSALEEARNEAKHSAEQLQALQEKLSEYEGVDPGMKDEFATLQRQVELYEQQLKDAEIDPKDLPENFKLTDERREELIEYGQVGETLVALYDSMMAKQARTVEPEAQAIPSADPVMDAINADADLSRWFKSELSWGEVQKVDAYVKNLPEFDGKSLSERIPKIVEMTRQRLGETAPAPKPDEKTELKPGGKPPEPETPAPSSITEIAGQTPSAEMTPREQIANAPDEAAAAVLMQKFMDKGLSTDDLL